MDRLNYHHLRYFRAVAHEGNLTRVAKRLNVSQSALSAQIKQLEESFGHALFNREGRSLVLTEAGRLALDHADRIFKTGEELLSTLGPNIEKPSERQLNVGAISTLSRNFQLQFLRPVLEDQTSKMTLISGNSADLLEKLESLMLDIVLATSPAPAAMYPDFIAHLVSSESVALFGTPTRLNYKTLEELLQNEPIILPTESSIRTGFESLAAQRRIQLNIIAEVDDMAMVRLLTREGLGVAVVPPVVVADEISQGILIQAPFELSIFETFYAIVTKRQFQHPLIEKLVATTIKKSSNHLPKNA